MLVVIADDISGAAELAALAHSHGLTAEVQTSFNPNTRADLIALDTGSRNGTAEEAERKVREAAILVQEARPVWVYKKTDSVLRGHVRVELTTLMKSLNFQRALLISANPSRGRVIRNGTYFVNGIPLNETIFAKDPDYPAFSANLEKLICRGGGADVHLLNSKSALPHSGIAVPDVTCDLDLKFYVSFQKEILHAGAADFFTALLTERFPATSSPKKEVRMSAENTLLVSGSAAAWSKRNAECTKHQIRIFSVPAEAYPSIEHASAAGITDLFSRDVASALHHSGRAVLAVGDPPVGNRVSSEEFVETLGQATLRVLSKTCVDRLLLEGGATAAAVIRRLGWVRLEVVDLVGPGMAILRVVGKEGTQILIKPGTYEWPPDVWPPNSSP